MILITRGRILKNGEAKVFGLRPCKHFMFHLEIRLDFPLRNSFTAPSTSPTAGSIF